jgi:hypothetical protein
MMARVRGAEHGSVRMRRVRCHTLLLWIDNQIHGLERNDAHQALIPQDSGLGQERAIVEPDFNGLDP